MATETSLDPYRYEEPARAPGYERYPELGFDRLAFALRALDVLALPRTRVAVFSSRRLEVKQGMDLMRGADARWVMLGVPEDASPESIVLALARIEGFAPSAYRLDATLDAAEAARSAN